MIPPSKLTPGELTSDPAGRAAWWTARAGEAAVAALAWFGMQELAHLRLTAGWWGAVLAGWVACWIVAAQGRTRRPAWRALWAAMEGLGPLVILLLMNGHWAHPLANRQLLYAAGLLWAVAGGWRAWAGWRVRGGAEPVAEPWRILLVGAAPLCALLPYFTDRQIGGTDARWYALMLRDYLDQLHAGVFPVFIGQGEYAWNGGVHPFRTAPLYMNLAGILDLATWRSLGAVAVQNMTLITVGLAGALGFYAAAAALLPRRRWVAAGLAVMYAIAPAWLGALYQADAHMTFVTLAVLPALLYGNARSMLAENGRGYIWLAVGLSAVWMSHPPTALLSTLLTVLLQGGSFLFGRAPLTRWRGAAGGAVLFAGMSGYYFVGMGELPNAPGAGRQDALQIGGLLLALAGLGNGLIRGRSRWWLLLVPAGAAVAGQGSGPWMAWIGVTGGLVTVVAGVMHARGTTVSGRWGLPLLFAALLVGAGIVRAWLGPDHPARNGATLAGLNANGAHSADFFKQIKADLPSEASMQPGAGLWLALAAMGVAFAVAGGSVAARMFFVAGCLPVFSLVRVPWVSEFLLGFVPPGVAPIVSFTMPMRILPLTSGVLAMGGVVLFATWPPALRSNWRRRLETALVLAAAIWALWESVPFIRRGWASTSSRTVTIDNMRPENAILDRFAYDLLPHPPYFSHGRTDPWLQARVLDVAENVVIGPDETARQMERAGAQRLRLTAATEVTAPRWVNLSPAITVNPGEKLLLRFEFATDVNYKGVFVWVAPHGYRAYELPESGLSEGFGVSAQNSRVISLVNSTDQPAVHKLSLLRQGGNTLRGDGDFFADVVISRYDPARAEVRVESLLPYRVTASILAPGWIETSRIFLPGYRATLDGKQVAVRNSRRGLAMVAVVPGRHELKLGYVGTKALRTALGLSGLCWAGWLCGVTGLIKGRRNGAGRRWSL